MPYTPKNDNFNMGNDDKPVDLGLPNCEEFDFCNTRRIKNECGVSPHITCFFAFKFATVSFAMRMASWKGVCIMCRRGFVQNWVLHGTPTFVYTKMI